MQFFLVIATIFLLGACSSKIEGEAFVVTKGGESKKLGLVEVKAYKMSDIEGFKRKLFSEYSEFIDKISDDYKFVGLKEKYDERKQLISDINESKNKYEKCRMGLFGKECDGKLPAEIANDFALRKKKIELGTLATIADKAVKLDEKFDLTFLAKRVAEHTKNHEVIKTKTDADGKFSMTLPSGEYLIVAVGSRQSLGEDYFWLLRTSKSGTIRLANDSMFDQGCDTCLFSKDDLGKLNDIKNNVLASFIKTNNGSMMLYEASKMETGIYADFWGYMCGYKYAPQPGKRVFEWAERVD